MLTGFHLHRRYPLPSLRLALLVLANRFGLAVCSLMPNPH